MCLTHFGSRSVHAAAEMRTSRYRPNLQSGFTLIEVLVSVLILSFGVLGVVGLQAAAMQANKDSRHQSAAIRMGRELGDMMRSNKDIAVLTAANANPYLIDYTGALPVASTDCYATACSTPLKVASFNAREWTARVASEFPGARVKVCFDETPYNTGGTPQWACSNTGGLSVVKIGWTRQALNSTGGTGSSGLERATNPSVILPLIAGSVE